MTLFAIILTIAIIGMVAYIYTITRTPRINDDDDCYINAVCKMQQAIQDNYFADDAYLVERTKE